MASESNFIESITSAQLYLYRVGGPILMFVGGVSCILSLIVFTKKDLRKNPCSMYFVANNANNIILIYTSALIVILNSGYNINPSIYSLSFCRFNFYITYLTDILGPSYLILASIDRILVTSPNALTRRRSTQRLAYICIISVTLFWMLFHCHTLIFPTIIEYSPTYFVCYFPQGGYLAFASYYAIVVKVFLVPLLLVVLGLWTIKNIRSVRRVNAVSGSTVVETVVGGSRSTHSKDRQLIRILLVDIGVYIIFSLMISIILMYEQITQYQTKSSDQIQFQSFLLAVSYFSNYIPACVGCYTNLLVSKTFRNTMKKILLCQ